MQALLRQYLRLGVTAVIAALLSAGAAWPQSGRTIKLVVPVAPGGPSDTLARLLADEVAKTQGVTIVVENRPGAGSVIGTEAVAHAPPDGNTLLLATPGLVANAHLRQLDYDPVTSFEPICKLVNDPPIIVVNGASPYRTLGDFVTAARAMPGALTLASVGPATPPHITVELLKRADNINLTFVPYRGYAPSITALLGGHVTAALADYAVVAEHVRAGKLTALAVTSQERIEQMPDVPTAAEAGYKDFEVDVWFGLTAPAKTPRDTIAELARWFTAALKVPAVKEKLVAQGIYPAGICGADFAAFIRRQYDDYGRIIRDANIKAE
jgi:tripartite-type tricarboxylate transporter receptor subunit TctC